MEQSPISSRSWKYDDESEQYMNAEERPDYPMCSICLESVGKSNSFLNVDRPLSIY